MKTRSKTLALAAATLLALAGASAASASPLPGYDCESVYTGGAWISHCTDAAGTDTILERVGGANRYDTSALLSATTFQPGVPVVYIANGVTLVDALGAGAAARGDGPVLVVPATGTLPATVAAELTRLNPARIVIVGGPASVSDDMAAQVAHAAAR